MIKLFKTYPRLSLLLCLVLLIWYGLVLPNPLFQSPYSKVLEDKDGQLLGARIARDGQWRFPMRDSLPEKFVESLIAFEDKRFYWHPGVDLISMGRAIIQNIRNGRIVSGGSTLSMQVIRMARNKQRTIGQKIVEILLATRLELGYSKAEILYLYAAHAPFGGNVVGLEAACWRYFSKKPSQLSWAESATLAVLPNSPALIHPGRNRADLLAKRNRLLDKLLKAEKLDSLSWELAKSEPLPEQVHALPTHAPHLLDRISANSSINRLKSTIDIDLQKRVSQVLERNQQLLKYNEIHNLAAIVIEVETGEVLAYMGNVFLDGQTHGQQVDVIQAPRSTGSILKPILYASMLHEGVLLPNSLVQDIPLTMNGYRPENFHERFDGVVTAKRALERSLNVPFVAMLQTYGLEKLHFNLKKLQFESIRFPASHYGLPLILGGAESTLWEITQAYANMSRLLGHFYDYNGQYDLNDFKPISYQPVMPREQPKLVDDSPIFSASAIWLMFEAMKRVERPNSEGQWERFASNQQIAWKTGTSFGFRDAWAVGVTRDYVVGVWAGNADGEGRPGLIGVKAAAPTLFDLFDLLPQSDWFDQPFDEMEQIQVCKASGYRARDICPKDTIWAPKSGYRTPACAYHQLIHLDPSESYQVNANCETAANIVHKPWFVLPPVEAHYYQVNHPSYQQPPSWRADCIAPSTNAIATMQLIYPKYPTQIYVPIDINGKPSRTVFSVAHRNPNTSIYWHIDNEFVKRTKDFHSIELDPAVGKHRLTLVDEKGERLEQDFEIIAK